MEDMKETKQGEPILIKIDNDYDLKIYGGEYKKRGDNYYLYEWNTYYAKIVPKNKELEESNNRFSIYIREEKQEQMDKRIAKNVFKLRLKNYIGKSHIIVSKNDIKIKYKPIEIISKKFKYIENKKDVIETYNSFISQMISDIIKSIEFIKLPFHITSPTAFPVRETDAPMDELFALHFMINNKNKNRIISAYEEILRRPHKKLVESREFARFDEVSEADEEVLLSIVTHPEHLVETNTAKEISPALARALNHRLPERVLQIYKYESFDTPENRFALYFLKEMLYWIDRVLIYVEKVSGNEKEKYEKLIRKLRELESHLESFYWSDVFSDVGEMQSFPYTSQVLLRREGYRELLTLWREFKSYVPFFEELEKAIENKDVPTLYEYWCFFELTSRLKKIFGEKSLEIPVTPLGELESGGKVIAEFENGWKLKYNLKMTNESYSVSLKPDFSLYNKEDNLVGIFDAKFKVDIPDVEKFADEDEDLEKNPSFKSWAKLEDIYKMHTYRDALQVKFAVVLYPGRKCKFFDIQGEYSWEKEKVTYTEIERLLKDIVNNRCGVGYISFLPGEFYG